MDFVRTTKWCDRKGWGKGVHSFRKVNVKRGNLNSIFHDVVYNYHDSTYYSAREKTYRRNVQMYYGIFLGRKG